MNFALLHLSLQDRQRTDSVLGMLSAVHRRPHSGPPEHRGDRYSAPLCKMRTLWSSTARVEPEQPLVLDSPHSGRVRRPTSTPCSSEADAAQRPKTASSTSCICRPRSAAFRCWRRSVSRVYLDVNRLAGDIDPELLDAPWPRPLAASGKARLGKALIWRTLDDGRPIYAAPPGRGTRCSARIERCHPPYHQALRACSTPRTARFGQVVHINCHSMNAVAGSQGEGGAGVRARRLRARRPRRHHLRPGVDRIRARHVGGDGL